MTAHVASSVPSGLKAMLADGFRVAGQRLFHLARLEVPEQDGAVPRGGRQRLAVRAEGQVHHHRGRCVQRADLCTARRFPDPYRRPHARDEEFAVRAEGQAAAVRIGVVPLVVLDGDVKRLGPVRRVENPDDVAVQDRDPLAVGAEGDKGPLADYRLLHEPLAGGHVPDDNRLVIDRDEPVARRAERQAADRAALVERERQQRLGVGRVEQAHPVPPGASPWRVACRRATRRRCRSLPRR